MGVHAPEENLRTGIALLSRQADPAHGFGIVFRYALPGGVHISELDLRVQFRSASRNA